MANPLCDQAGTGAGAEWHQRARSFLLKGGPWTRSGSFSPTHHNQTSDPSLHDRAVSDINIPHPPGPPCLYRCPPPAQRCRRVKVWASSRASFWTVGLQPLFTDTFFLPTQKLRSTNASQKMRCSTSRRTNTRAWTSPTSPVISSSTTYGAHVVLQGQHSDVWIVEWLRRAPAALDCAKPGYIAGLLLHHWKHCIARALHTGSCRTSKPRATRHCCGTEGSQTLQAPSWVYYSFAFGMWM